MIFSRAALMGLGLVLSSTAFAGATASNFQPENRKGANYWNAASALDGDMETCWRLPGESAGVGEWIEIGMPKGKVDKIGMVNGWLKDEDTYKDYARVKQVRVDVMSQNDSFELELVGSATVDFADKPEMQVIDMEDIDIPSDAGGSVKLTVTEIYPGVDYPALAVSEVEIMLSEDKFSPPSSLNIISAEGSDQFPDDMLDGNVRTAWVGTSAETKLVLQATGFGMSRIGLQRTSTSFDRPKKVKISVGTKEAIVTVPDSKDMVWVKVPSTFGYSGSTLGDVTLEILEVYPGTSNAGKISISEVTAKATNFDALTF